MESFNITTAGKSTLIIDEASNIIVKVEKDRILTEHDNGPILEATLYKEEGTFIPVCSYIFTMLDSQFDVIVDDVDDVDIDTFNEAIAFFFNTILGTDYFVKSVPVCSSHYVAQARFKPFMKVLSQ